MTDDKTPRDRMDELWDDLDRGHGSRRTVNVGSSLGYGVNGGAVTSFDDFRARTGQSNKLDYKFGSEKCTYSHPALKMPGTDFVIYGGSCINPAVQDADIYIGFDGGMKFTQRSWPWKQGTEFLFKIRDMDIPQDAAEFRKLVLWVKTQMEAGKKVHVGCIGGHGRTGMFLSALVSLYGEADAITYVRKNYCSNVVESSGQVAFLNKEYGVVPVKGSKSGGDHRSHSTTSLPQTKKTSPSKPSAPRTTKITETIHPLASSRSCIWGVHDPRISPLP